MVPHPLPSATHSHTVSPMSSPAYSVTTTRKGLGTERRGGDPGSIRRLPTTGRRQAKLLAMSRWTLELACACQLPGECSTGPVPAHSLGSLLMSLGDQVFSRSPVPHTAALQPRGSTSESSQSRLSLSSTTASGSWSSSIGSKHSDCFQTCVDAPSYTLTEEAPCPEELLRATSGLHSLWGMDSRS